MSREELVVYYDRELEFMRTAAAEFAIKYPEIAGALQIPTTPDRAADPHVERLIEAFAMLAARIQLRLDDEFSEITDALLGILYPHYVAPIPSLAIVQLEPDPEGTFPPDGLQVARHALLYSKPDPVQEIRCRFRTSYPVTLWPIQVESAELADAAALGVAPPPDVRSILRLRLRTLGGASFTDLRLNRLRLFLGARASLGHRLYTLFCRDPQGLAVQARQGTPARLLPPKAIVPVGFARDEGLLEYPSESFLGYRILQEYFTLAQKFLFVDLCDLETWQVAGDAQSIDVSLLLTESRSELDLSVEASDFRLGCTPAANLFEKNADSIHIAQTEIEYPVFPDGRYPQTYEVYSIRAAYSAEPGGEPTRFEPIYTARHGSHGHGGAYWYASRRGSLRKGDTGTDVFLSLVDEKFNPLTPPSELLHVTALCTNRDLVERLTFGARDGDFDVQGYPDVKRVACLGNPTKPLRAPLGSGSRWRLISHLALNHLSLSDSAAGLDALREILKLYDFEDSPATRQRIAGLIGMRTRRITRRVHSSDDPTFARGTEVELLFDPGYYVGTGAFLFASVLEAFLGLYASLNSFTQTVACMRTYDGVLKQWPLRAGEHHLL